MKRPPGAGLAKNKSEILKAHRSWGAPGKEGLAQKWGKWAGDRRAE